MNCSADECGTSQPREPRFIVAEASIDLEEWARTERSPGSVLVYRSNIPPQPLVLRPPLWSVNEEES